MRSMDSEIPVVGIDEVGRGPLAGPVSICAVIARGGVLSAIKASTFFTDSKKMTEKRRESVFKIACEEREMGRLNFAVSSVSAEVIDSVGINRAVSIGLERSLKKLEIKHDTPILLDGGLKAPARYLYQSIIEKGDLKEDAIALASVLAKVSRDRKMARYDRRFLGYGFLSNKGYGTKGHIESIKRMGCCEIHRRTYLRSIFSYPQ